MEKSILMCASMLLLSLFTSCGDQTTVPEENEDINNQDSSSLILYFSATGTTQGVANKMKEAFASDIEEIVPVTPYTDEDLNYRDDSSRANIEQNDPNARPEYVPLTSSVLDYDNIFIGYPIWHGRLPKIIYSLFDDYDLSNKTIFQFCTSGSTGISTSVNEIKESKPNANVLDGRRFVSNVSAEEISSWVNGLNIF